MRPGSRLADRPAPGAAPGRAAPGKGPRPRAGRSRAGRCPDGPPSPGVGHQARTARDWPGPGGQGQDGQRPRRGRVPTGHARGRFRVFAPGEATRADFSQGRSAPEGQRRARSRARSAREGPRQRAGHAGQGQRAKRTDPQGRSAQRRGHGGAQGSGAPEAATGPSPWPRGSGSPASGADGPAGPVRAAAAAWRSSGGSSAGSGDGLQPVAVWVKLSL